MSICQRKVTNMIFVMGRKLDEMSSVVLGNEGLWCFYFDFYDMGICVFNDLHSYSLGRAGRLLGLGSQ